MKTRPAQNVPEPRQPGRYPPIKFPEWHDRPSPLRDHRANDAAFSPSCPNTNPKFCSYFPYTAKLCFNGHEYAKRQLAQAGIAFEALDNGILNCADPAPLQATYDGLSPEKIDAFARKGLARLPQPFTPDDRAAGYGYRPSILQAEFSLTQVLDRP